MRGTHFSDMQDVIYSMIYSKKSMLTGVVKTVQKQCINVMHKNNEHVHFVGKSCRH